MPQSYTVPLTGKYNTRINKSNALSSNSGVVGVGVVGTFIVGQVSVSTDKDERWVNCFMTREGAKEYYVKRPGMAVLNTPATGEAGTAIIVWAGQGSGDKIITAFGGTNSRIFDGTTSIGAITGVCLGIVETFVGSQVPTLTITSDDSTGWYYDVATGVTTKITDAQFPGNDGYTLVGSFAPIDGFNCVMTDDGKLWASDLNSITAWTANSYGSTDVSPDKGIGCVPWKNYIMAFGALSLEFWTNAGLTPFPLVRSKTMTVNVGAIAAKAITKIADTIFWAGSTPQGGVSIFMWDGKLSRISTPQQDFQFLLAGTTNISLTTLRFFGLSFVLVKASTSTFVYCLEDKRWHEWVSAKPYWERCAGLSVGNQVITYSVSELAADGVVYLINPASIVFTDDSTAYTATIQSAVDDQGSPNVKFWHDLRVICDRELAASDLTITVSDDDYQTTTTLGTVDLSQPNPRLTRLGASDRRAWQFSHSADTPFRIEKFVGALTMGQAPRG